MREKRWINNVLAAVVMAVAVASCGVSRPSSSSAKHSSPITHHPSPEISHEESLRYNYFFLEAMRQQNAANYDAAYDLLNRCVDINPKAAEAWFYLSMYQADLGQDSLALNSMEKRLNCDPTTPLIRSNWRSITSIRGSTTRRRPSMSNWPKISVSARMFCRCSSAFINRTKTTTE